MAGAFSDIWGESPLGQRVVPEWEASPDLENPQTLLPRHPFPNTSAAPGPLRGAADASFTSNQGRAMRLFHWGAARATSMRERERTRPSRNKEENVERPHLQPIEETISPPTELCRVDEVAIPAMAPGDIFIIEKVEAPGLNPETTFYAILACPLCGNRDLISAAQFFGCTPIICGARACPGFFRIVNEGRLVYLPVN